MGKRRNEDGESVGHGTPGAAEHQVGGVTLPDPPTDDREYV